MNRICAFGDQRWALQRDDRLNRGFAGGDADRALSPRKPVPIQSTSNTTQYFYLISIVDGSGSFFSQTPVNRLNR